jgi:hypothetical protein
VNPSDVVVTGLVLSAILSFLSLRWPKHRSRLHGALLGLLIVFLGVFLCSSLIWPGNAFAHLHLGVACLGIAAILAVVRYSKRGRQA